ncbi:Polycystic kidney disease protein 1-like 2 PC1-like 2 protein Polycystin-1L2 Precursor [Channa argus]|uniref:Polycystic kidney disease protein 1-like 2 PC1-like 2 protein Polycystin-1L2 n=1 Tax=Channa argus TaxID=215402 RepID=A0A6G1PY19_CHAAH|nr:Polycystic kidney disease protein 1-like 2 PC1-like 2 protein Polycystin-1L2 Precursor [Channa argus]
MCWTVLHLLILMTLSSLMLAEDEHVSCPDNQKSFGGSCYEFVGLQRSFFSAQAWCEKSGGHLAFIPNKETQYFLQRQLDHDKDAWLGVAQSASNNLQYPPTAEALCDGRQACQVAEVMKSFGEPCPVLGSYLSVDYQCKDGINYQNHVSSSLTNTDRLESSVVHKYSHPSTFVVTVKCTSNDIRTTAEKIIMIQEPIAEIGAIRCYAGNLSFNATNCKALYGRAFQIQMEVNAGTNVTYTIQSNKILLSSLSVARGSIPHNITVIPEMVAQLGPGCHQLKLYASNMVTFPQVSADLQRKKHNRVIKSLPDITATPSYSVPTRNSSIKLSTSDPSGLNDNSKRLTCTQGCDPVNENTDAKFNLDCKGHDQCNQVVWNIEDLNNKDWPDETKSCYSNAGKNPLKVMQNGGTELTVSQSYLKMAKYNKQDLVVVIYSGDVVPLYTTYTINTFSSENPKPTPTKQSDATDKTTKGGNGEGEQNGPYPPNVPATPSTENQGPNPASNTKQPGASDKTTKGGNGEGEQNGPFPPNVPATPSTENQGPNPASNTKQPGASDKTTKGGNGEGEQNGPYPPNVPATPSTENQGPNPASNTKQPGASDKTTKGGNGEGEQNRPYPPNVPATPSTENQGPNPASTTKKPDATDKTTKGGSNEGETNSAYPSNTNGPIGVTTITITTARTSQTSLPISNNLNRFSCSISPSSGTILDAFSITCKTNFHCSKCHYCFKIKEKQLRCSMNNEVKSLFLPLGDKSSNYNLVITATVKQGNLVDTTTMTTQVKDSTAASGASVNGLKASLESAVDKLKNQGLMSGEAIGQLLSSLSSHLNSQSQELEKGDGQKLRVQMLGIMIDAVKEAPPTTPDNVQVIADGISAIIQPGTEPSNLAQEQASLLLVDLSSSLLHMIANSSEESMNEIISAASTIVEGASNILEYSSSKNISDAVLNTLYNIQSALLMFKSANDGPTIIQQANIAVFVKRLHILEFIKMF